MITGSTVLDKVPVHAKPSKSLKILYTYYIKEENPYARNSKYQSSNKIIATENF
jgi:hypothetical protein